MAGEEQTYRDVQDEDIAATTSGDNADASSSPFTSTTTTGDDDETRPNCGDDASMARRSCSRRASTVCSTRCTARCVGDSRWSPLSPTLPVPSAAIGGSGGGETALGGRRRPWEWRLRRVGDRFDACFDGLCGVAALLGDRLEDSFTAELLAGLFAGILGGLSADLLVGLFLGFVGEAARLVCALVWPRLGSVAVPLSLTSP